MNLVYWFCPQGEQAPTVTKFKITKAPERLGTYVDVTVITPAFTGTPVVWTLQYYDVTGAANEWYQVQSLDLSDHVVAKSEPRKGEPVPNSLFDLLWRLRRKIGDLGPAFCFADYELIDLLNECLVIHSRSYEWTQLPSHEEILILYLATSKVANIMAQDSAKYFPLSIDGITVDKGVRTERYLAIAKQYKEDYDEKWLAWQVDAEKSGTIKESYFTRESFTTGRRVSYIHALPPESVRLSIGEQVTAGSVQLRWNPSHDPGFYYYVIFRAQAPNIQKGMIEDVYHKRIALYDDPGDYTSGLWSGITFPVRMIFRNSVVEWVDQNRLMNDPFFPPGSAGYPRLHPGGTFYYVLGVVNKNILLSLSNELAVTLPMVTAPALLPVYSMDGFVAGQGIPTADVFLQAKQPGAGDFSDVAQTKIPTGTVNAFTFAFGAGFLQVGSQVRARQVFQTVDSGYGTPVTVV